MKNLEAPSIWYITGSQDLYGESTLNQVAANSREILESLNGSQRLPLKLLFRPTLTRPEEVRALCLQANDDPNCAGLILWMHTFSPSKMWIGGLSALRKPFLHLHTQFNRDLPWSEIDMDFMNLNQSAHGDREAGFIHTRLRLNRKVVVGHWSDEEVQDRIAAWMRVSHMLEVCESIAAGRPSLEIHPLGIGGKEDPVRLVFNAHPGRAVNASLIDLGNRFWLVVNELEAVDPLAPLPKLPVARAVWKPQPNFKTAGAAWIYAGGSHHTGYSYAVTTEHLEDLAEIAGVELVVIDAQTELRSFKNELRQNEIYYHLAPGLGRLWGQTLIKIMSNYDDIKQECYEANLLLPEYKLIDLTFGNVSVADSERQVFAIKPSGVDYRVLRVEDIVVVDFEGKVVEGALRPSSDTPTHHRLFRAFTGIRSIVHTHSRNAVAFAQAGRGIPCLGTTHADYFFGEIPVTRPMTRKEIESAYEWETGNVIVERFKDLSPIEVSAVLVHSHGPFVWGSTGKKAVENALAVEIVAEMALKAIQLSPQVRPISSDLLGKHFLRKHGKTAYYGQG